VDNLESMWQVALLAVAAGAVIGALAYRLFAPSLAKADKVRSELEAARQELIDYKASVNSHFDKTSELVHDLTQNYVKVYQHLAEGAQTLGGSRELNKLLEQQPGKVLLAVDDQSPLQPADAVAENFESGPARSAPVAAEDTAVVEAAGDEPGQAAEDSADAAVAGGEAVEARGTATAPDEPSSSGPRIDVSKIEQGDAETELGTMIPESGKNGEIKPTRH